MLFELRAAFYESRVLFFAAAIVEPDELVADGSLGLKIRNRGRIRVL